ncbi:glycosyltransferase family 2 protein [Vibrio sp. SM6]|uniref:Glycosyltransferase family 2 protein n=1 Tax=Vibrio agarilyticus TaxID=2726741 RepID=A0A7X8TPW6_9VIBR|nr:glycosyltransferase family 2 protein [Vibrio agarilyticus]NLS12043.1 glycosyltransferase family 2 protein [Vibrio agarilyticus]
MALHTSTGNFLNLLNSSHQHFDLTDHSHQRRLLFLADELLKLTSVSVAQLQQAATVHNAPIEFRLAVKLVESRRMLTRLTEPVNVAVVYAMWGEHNRLLPKSATNLNGEDALRVKIEQLQWITKGTNVNWQLIAVDDGCPHGSAQLAREILQEYPSSVSVRVEILELAAALPAQSGPLRNLESADDSRKGGAIILGCERALERHADAVIYTDADSSVHLGQIGLLLAPYVHEGAEVVLGNRKDPLSILVKQEARWGVGIKSLRHMQRMIGHAIFEQGIKDTQAAFKLYSRKALESILQAPTVYDFSFDTDWIFAAMAEEYTFTTVPFAFIDSAAESASIVQGPMTTWYVLLDGLIKSAQARGVEYNQEMAAVFYSEIESHHDLELIIDVLPPELAHVDDKALGDASVMSPQAMRNWILSAKALEQKLEQMSATLPS